MKKATCNGRGGPAPALSGVEGCPPVRRADTQVGPYTRPAIDSPKWAWVFTIGFTFAMCGAVAHAQTPFYQGKTITLIVGSAPGGTGDLRIKATLPYLSKYIPGNPNIVAQHVAGAGGRTAANQMYKLVKPDGLTIGNLGASMVTNAVLGASGVEYDVDKFIYLGSPDSIVHWVFATRKEAGLNTIEKLRSATARCRRGKPLCVQVAKRIAITSPVRCQICMAN